MKKYILIDKIGKVEPGQEAGQNEKGDVIVISPFTSQYKPTRAELQRYLIKVVDVTDDVIQTLTEPIETDVIAEQIEAMPNDKYAEWLKSKETEYGFKEKNKDINDTTTIVRYKIKFKHTLVARKNKIDIDKLSDIQEEEIDVLTLLDKKITKIGPTI